MATRLLLTVACVCLLAQASLAQDLSYLRRLPSNQTVEAKFVGADAIETAAMRVAAFRALLDLTVDLGEDTYRDPNNVRVQFRQVTSQEYAARQRYDRAYWQYVERIPQSTRKATLARYDPDASRDRALRLLFTDEDRNAFQNVFKRNAELVEEYKARVVPVTSSATMNAIISAAVHAKRGSSALTPSPALNAALSTWVRIPPLVWLAVFGGLTILATLVNFARFRVVWTAKPPQLIARRRTDICSMTGHVVDASKVVEQHFRPGYTERLADGTTRSVAPSSSSTMREQIFIVDPNGVEHALQLTDWNLAVRPGHRLSMIWFSSKGRNTPYLAFYNHDTRDARYLGYPLRRFIRTSFKPGLILWLGGIVQVLAVLVTLAETRSTPDTPYMVGVQQLRLQLELLFAYGAGWIGFMIARTLVTSSRLRRIKSEIFGRIFEELAGTRPGVAVTGGVTVSKA